MKSRVLIAIMLVGAMVLVGRSGAGMLEFRSGDVLRAIDLNALVKALTGVADPTPIQVNCPADSLAEALQSALPGSTLQISGTCTERVRITTDRLTLNGQGSAVLDGGGGFAVSPTGFSQGVVTIDSARGVTLQGFTVQNGPHGILSTNGAVFTLRRVTARGNAGDGISVTNGSTALIADCTAEDNGDDGISVTGTSRARFHGTVSSTGNRDEGIIIFSSSSGAITSGSTVLANNNGNSATFGVSTSDGFINGEGLTVKGSSHFSMGANSTLQVNANADDGIVVARTSTFEAYGQQENGPVSVTADNNGQLRESGDGIEVSGTSYIAISGTLATLSVANNAGQGISISSSSSSSFTRAIVRPTRPATPADLSNRGFTFINGAAFGLEGQEVALSFGDFAGTNTGTFTLTASATGFEASGTVVIASCTFTVLSSDFPLGEGPQAEEVIPIDPCEIDQRGDLIATNANTGVVSGSN